MTKKNIFRDSWKIATEFPRVPNYCFCFGVFFFGGGGFCFFGFSWIGFAGIWRLASFLSYTILCNSLASLIELSTFRIFYCSWQLMPNLLGLVLVFCFLSAYCFLFVFCLIFWLWWCVVLLALVLFVSFVFSVFVSFGLGFWI